MKYSEIRDNLRTGDIVLFAGQGAISWTIQKFTKSPYSHIGMVINSYEWDMLLLWESTTLSKLKDLRSGEAREGVQIVPLSERIRTYEGSVAVRSLQGIEMTFEMKNALKEFRNEVKGRPYEKSKLELFKSAYDGPAGHNNEDLSSLFCSEQVAEAYQRMQIFTEERSSNEYTPADFHKDDSKLPFIGDAHFGDLTEIEV